MRYDVIERQEAYVIKVTCWSHYLRWLVIIFLIATRQVLITLSATNLSSGIHNTRLS